MLNRAHLSSLLYYKVKFSASFNGSNDDLMFETKSVHKIGEQLLARLSIKCGGRLFVNVGPLNSSNMGDSVLCESLRIWPQVSVQDHW